MAKLREIALLILSLVLVCSAPAQSLVTSKYAQELDNLHNNQTGGIGETSIKNINILTADMPEVVKRNVSRIYPVATRVNLEIFKTFSTMMFIIAVAIVSYTLVDSVLRTAMEGDVMGRKHPKYLLLLRSIFGVIFFLPTSSGYTLLQTFINYVAIKGIELANIAWASIAASMLMYNGGIGNVIIANSSISRDFGNQYYHATAGNVTNALATIEKAETKKQIYIDGASAEQVKEKTLLSQLSSMYCLYNEVFVASGSEDINKAVANYREQFTNITKRLMVESNWQTSGGKKTYTMSYPKINNRTTECGSYAISIDEKNFSGIRALYIDSLRRISSAMETSISIYEPDELSKITKARLDNIVKSLMNTSKNIAYQVTLLIADHNANQMTKSGGIEKPEVKDLIDGGWAMMAFNYDYYTRVLDAYGNSTSGTVVSDMSSTSWLPLEVVTTNESVLANNSFFSTELKTNLISSYEKSVKAFAQNTANNSNDNGYCTNNPNCNKINKHIFSYDNGVPRAKKITQSLYSSFKTQIPDLDHVQSFIEIGKQTTACSIPFAPAEGCASLSSTGPSLGPMNYKVAIGMIFGGLAALTIGAAVGFFKMVGVGIFLALVMPYAGAAYASNWTDLITIFKDPSALYPRSLAWDIQAFTYFLVKAWYDTFIFNQAYIFYYPVASLSAFGMRSLGYCVAFIIRIGTDTFASIYSTSFDLLMRRIYLEIALSVATMYAGMASEWGYRYFVSHLANPMPFGPWQFSWFMGMFRYPGIPIPAPPGIMCNFTNYFCIPFIFPIIIPMHLIIGGIVMAIGVGLHIVKMAITLSKLFDVTDILAQVKLFITTRYNPVYFGIAIPLIILSATFGMLIPMYPLIVYSLSVISYFIMYIEAIVAAPLVLLGMVIPDGHAVFGKADKILQLLLMVYIRPFMTVVGFVFANATASLSVMLLYETAIPMLNTQIGVWAAGYAMMSTNNSGGHSSEMLTATITILALYMFVYIYYQVVTYSFSMVYKIPNAANRYLGMPTSQSEQEDTARMEEIAEQFKDMTRNLASAGTETAGKSEEGAAAMDPLAAADKQEAGAKEDAKKSEQSGSIAG